jgi:hypothetical protein
MARKTVKEALADWLPAGYVPGDSFLFLGTNPHHTPAHEGYIQDAPGLCPRCHAPFTSEDGSPPDPDADLLNRYETLPVACGRCHRSTNERELRSRDEAERVRKQRLADNRAKYDAEHGVEGDADRTPAPPDPP